MILVFGVSVRNMNLNLMKKIAKMSNHKYQHCTLILAGSRLISYGYNRDDLHAEEVAINRAMAVYRNQHRIPHNLHMINLMIKKDSGNLGNSRPCDYCLFRARAFGVRTITYFNPDGRPIQMGGSFWTLAKERNFT